MQQKQILRDEAARQRQDQRTLEGRSRRPPTCEIPTSTGPQGHKGGACLAVERIVIDGAAAVSASALHKRIRSYEHRCLTATDLDAVLRVLTDDYVAHGYVTSRVYIPAQTLAGGTLRLDAVEGRIAGLRMVEPHKTGAGSVGGHEIAMAFPGLAGEPLSLRDLEQGLDQINRLMSNDARLRLEPGAKAGETDVVIDNQPRARLRGNISIDNSGLPSTGVYQGGVALAVDDLLGLDDFWSLSARHSLATGSGHHASQSYSAIFSVPYGRFTLTLSGSWFTYHNQILTPTQSFMTYGQSATEAAHLRYMLYRDDVAKTAVGAVLRGRQTENFIEDVRLPVSSPDLVTFDLFVSHDRRLAGGVFSADLHRIQGLDLFGATKDQTDMSGMPTARFERWTLNLRYLRPFTLAGLDLSWTAEGAAQWTEDRLYSSEQINVGGLATVRGFKDQSIGGDSGYYLRNELVWHPAILKQVAVTAIAGNLSTFIAYDYGSIIARSGAAFQRGVLQGMAVGLRASGGPLNLDLTFGLPLAAPSFIHKQGVQAYASATMWF